MCDPQYDLKLWLSDKLKEMGAGSCALLAEQLGVSSGMVSRMKCLDGTKECRTIPAHFIPPIAQFIGEWPPGFEELPTPPPWRNMADRQIEAEEAQMSGDQKGEGKDGAKTVIINVETANVESSGVMIVGNQAPITVQSEGEESTGTSIGADDVAELDGLVTDVSNGRGIDPLALKKELADALGVPDFSFIMNENYDEAMRLLRAWKERMVREEVNRNAL